MLHEQKDCGCFSNRTLYAIAELKNKCKEVHHKWSTNVLARQSTSVIFRKVVLAQRASTEHLLMFTTGVRQ